MILVGLTGSIGMGKSTTAAMFARHGMPVHDSDACVHALYRGKAVPLIEAAFPGTTELGAVDRTALGARVVGDRSAFSRLEAIVHPLVREAELAFRNRVRAAGKSACLLDIPLLFETGGNRRMDVVVVVTAEPEIQRQRVLARDGMTVDRFEAILAKQVPDREKRKGAHFLIDTGRGFEAAERQVVAITRALAGL